MTQTQVVCSRDKVVYGPTADSMNKSAMSNIHLGELIAGLCMTLLQIASREERPRTLHLANPSASRMLPA